MTENNEMQSLTVQQAEAVEELLLELSEPKMVTKNDGTRRARAKAKLSYFPTGKGKRRITGEETFRFTAPVGPIENRELAWYLEEFFRWPTGVFKDRARKVEKDLPEWGKQLYKAAMKHDSVREVLSAWNSGDPAAERRFTVLVESNLGKGTGAGKQADANEAATLLLGLPWELLHDGKDYLFQGARPVRVRRRLPFTRGEERRESGLPIRVLLVSPRPEDKTARYIDHRVSALPLVTALETLGDRVKLTVLSPPTFPALEEELLRALEAREPYDVVHFDGHGVYRRDLGLGGLCFEDPADVGKLEKRGTTIVDAKELAGVVRGHRVPLVFLEACESAKTEEDPTASVAAALLDRGVASVVAMSHTVLVETARRFVERFYNRLAEGARVGDAMLAGQRALKSDRFRLKIFGAGRLEMDDWFVPVLYQEEEDLRLLTRAVPGGVDAVDGRGSGARFGLLPSDPAHCFTGRSRELLKLERLLWLRSFAVVCGQGGEGKTTLAVEAARWMVRTGRFDRVVFVSVEDVCDVRAVVDRVGGQLAANYSVSGYSGDGWLAEAAVPIAAALGEKRTLVIFDNMETILPSDPPDNPLNKNFEGGPGGPAARGTSDKSPPLAFDRETLTQFFQFCKSLESVEGTRLIFTSREELPEPYGSGFHRVDLGRLERWDAVELVHRVMTEEGIVPKEDESGGVEPEVEALVESVNCHARSLVLLGKDVKEFGVRHTTEDLGRLMKRLHEKYPEERERSLYASVELSLGRLSPWVREKVGPLGVFEGGGHIANIAYVLEIEEEERDLLVGELVQRKLADVMAYGFIRFHPALCPYLRGGLDEAELARVTARLAESMRQLSSFLYEQKFKDTQLSATLTTLELPNLLRLLDHVRSGEDAEASVDLATTLEQLIEFLGRPRLLARVSAIREEESKKLGDWGKMRFESLRMEIERLLGRGDFSGALQGAQGLLERCLTAGEGAYAGAAYDTAGAFFMLGRVLKMGGDSEAALQPIVEAHGRFQRLADDGDDDAAGMASASLTEKGDCLLDLGRLEEAAAAYEAGIKISETLGDSRGTAVGKIQLGTVRLEQRRFGDALKAYEDALAIFEDLGEPGSVATVWHQTGRVHEEAGRFEAAEQAYRKSLALKVRQNNPAGEASTLNQLGNLYDKMGRLEESVVFIRQAADKYVATGDMAKEGVCRSNLAVILIKLERYDDARRELHRAMECKKPYGHAAEPWNAWYNLYKLEQAEGNGAAAARAREQAVQLYLSYRRDGGENHFTGGRLCHWFRQALEELPREAIENQLTELANDPAIPSSGKKLIQKLQAFLAGSRDPTLAEDAELYYRDAAEILLMIEKESDE